MGVDCIGDSVETFGLLVPVSRIFGVGYEKEVVKTKDELDGRDCIVGGWIFLFVALHE